MLVQNDERRQSMQQVADPYQVLKLRSTSCRCKLVATGRWTKMMKGWPKLQPGTKPTPGVSSDVPPSPRGRPTLVLGLIAEHGQFLGEVRYVSSGANFGAASTTPGGTTTGSSSTCQVVTPHHNAS